MTDRLHLQQRHREMLERLLREHLPGVEVWAYGSRVTGRSHDGSDLDLALRGTGLEEIPTEQLADFKDAVRESTIPFLVEARDWAKLPERFHGEIERDYTVLFGATTGGNEVGWQRCSLADITDNFDSIRVPVKRADRRHGPYPYYGASGIVDYVDSYLFDGEYLLVAEDGENLRTRKTPIAFLADGKFWVNNHAHILRGNGKGDMRYIMYAFSALDVSGYLTGSTIPKLTRGNLERIALNLPPISEQRAIAHILGTLDDKIKLNRRMNETLEAMAQAIFKDWFVDFGPTRAKAAGDPPYLAPELWDLFPDSLDNEDKPVGWARDRIGIHVEAMKGLSYKGAGLTDEANGIPLHNLNSILEGGGYKSDGLKFYSGDHKPRHIVRPGDLIVTNTEQGFGHLLIGYSALIPAWTGEEGLFSHHLYKVEPRPASPLSRVWLHFALSASWFGKAIRRYSNGTTVNMLPRDAFEIPEIIVPPSGLVRVFDKFVGPMLRSQEHAVGESATLAITRDLLLPKLMSGEIRLADAERAVEAVA